MNKLVLLLAFSCSGCHACIALLAEDEEPHSETPSAATTTTDPAPGAVTAPGTGTATAVVTATGATPTPRVAPTPASTTNANTGANTVSVAGRYECFQMRVLIGSSGMFNQQWVPGALAGFTIDGSGGYTSSGKPGSVSASANDVRFIGGPYDGWRGALGTNTTGFFVRFNGKNPGDPRIGDGTKSGDYQCYRQKS